MLDIYNLKSKASMTCTKQEKLSSLTLLIGSSVFLFICFLRSLLPKESLQGWQKKDRPERSGLSVLNDIDNEDQISLQVFNLVPAFLLVFQIDYKKDYSKKNCKRNPKKKGYSSAIVISRSQHCKCPVGQFPFLLDP